MRPWRSIKTEDQRCYQIHCKPHPWSRPHLHLTPNPHRVWLSGCKTRTWLQNLRVNVENEAENMEQLQDHDIRLVSLSALWVVLKLLHRFGPVDSVTVSVCNIGVGFCGDRDSCSWGGVCLRPAQRIPRHQCSPRVTARWRRSDELAFYGRYHALVGHIMATKTRPAGMTNRLFSGGKPPV